MDVKFGKIVSGNKNIFSAAQVGSFEGNFFSSGQEQKEKQQQEKHSSGLRLNDFDSNILENNAYQLISDEMFKLEHKIGILESNLSKLDTEIGALENLNYDIQLPNLKERRQKIYAELKETKKKYSELGISAKISSHITSAVNFTSKSKKNIFSLAGNFLMKNILSKLSKTFKYSQGVKDALKSLSDINNSVDELIKLQSPYGEKNEKYDKLIVYLNNVNSIHAQISKNMNILTDAKKKP